MGEVLLYNPQKGLHPDLESRRRRERGTHAWPFEDYSCLVLGAVPSFLMTFGNK